MIADLILNNGRIFTVDPARPWAQAVACRDGRIVAVGGKAEVMQLAGSPRQTQVIDAGGRLVLPGLTDTHVHFLSYVSSRGGVLLSGVDSLDEVRRRVRRAVEQAPPGSWVQGWGWDDARWGRPPDRALLDDIAPRTPVVLKRLDLHSYWVNSVALLLAGVGRSTPDPAKGRIDRDASGEPTGILREWGATQLVKVHIPEQDEAMLETWAPEVIAEAHRLGITGIHDQRMPCEGDLSFRVFQRLQQRGQLTLRVHMNLPIEFLADAKRLGLQPGFGDEWLWIGHMKVFADGSLGSASALMLEPYEGQPDNLGVVITPAEVIGQLLREAEEAGFRLAVHAIGDGAVREVVDLFDQAAHTAQSPAAYPMPHRIEHVQVIHPADLPRLGRCGAVASMQPVHLMTDWPAADRLWGSRGRYAYALRSLLDHGVCLAFGSDAPVAPLNPLVGIYAAVARQDEQGEPAGGWYPEERIKVEEAIRGYTIGPAMASGRQHVSGSVTPGKWADLVVLSHNLFEMAPAEMRGVSAWLTVVGGKVVYRQAG